MSKAEGGEDVETINKVLYRKKSSSTNSSPSQSELHDLKSKPKAIKEDTLRKDKKSIWNWKVLKAISLSRNKRFNCIFSVQVHLIEGLPLSFNDSRLCVHWKRRNALLVTPPAKVIQGVAEFQDILTHTYSIYGSRSGPHKSAKYEAKHFLLYASMLGAPELDLGKHQVDLTRLLPLTLEELEEEKSSGKWTSSFRLSGTAKGAVMNISFGYVIVGDNTSATRDNLGAPPNEFTSKENSMPLMNLNIKPSQFDTSVTRSGSLPSSTGHNYSSQIVEEVKDLHEVLPLSASSRAISVDILYKAFDEEKSCSPQHGKTEHEVFKENIDPIKPAVYSSSNGKKEKPEVNPGNEGQTCNLVHDKPEFDVCQEILEIVKPDDCSLPDYGIENFEEYEDNEFSVVDQGIEFSSNEQVKLEESIIKSVVDTYTVDKTWILDTAGIRVSLQDSAKQESQNELKDSSWESAVVHEFSSKKDDLGTKELLLQELELALNNISELETVAMESPNIKEAKSEYKLRKSHSLDDVTESVASEFLSMLGLDHSLMGLSFGSEIESPRELLLRQFEKETLSGGFSLFDFDTGSDTEADDVFFGTEQWKLFAGIKPAFSLPDLQKRHLIEFENVRSKQKVQNLEDLETEALMREWGLNERAFQHSPKKDYIGFGSPIYFLPEEPLPLPPLAEGLGPFTQTKDGGFLQSMNPSLFRNSRSDGTLIMQVSNPVVLPAEMGSGIMEILQCLASVGIEKLSMQANKLIPLEDITGKTMQQISRETKPVLQEGTHSGLKGVLSGGLKSDKFSSSSVGNQRGSEFVSLEDLAPLAMVKIEALSLEGLRIQSGMSNEDEPSSNIIAQSLGLHGAAALQLLDIKDSSNDDDGIIGLSLSLDEWMRLDSGEIDIDNMSEHTSKLLAAHHAKSSDLIQFRGKNSGRKCGLLENNFTLALMVQLRDPMRNYEAVGTPMISLVKVERVFVPPPLPKQRTYNRHVSEAKSSEEEEAIPEFRITQVHVAGLKTETQTYKKKKVVWGGTPKRQQRQQKSGSRWLIANGMGKKNSLMKSSKVVVSECNGGDTLWSVSSSSSGSGTRWKELVELYPYIRNPNIIIPNK